MLGVLPINDPTDRYDYGTSQRLGMARVGALPRATQCTRPRPKAEANTLLSRSPCAHLGLTALQALEKWNLCNKVILFISMTAIISVSVIISVSIALYIDIVSNKSYYSCLFNVT